MPVLHAGSLQGIIVMAVQQYTLIPREQWGVKIETHCPYVFFYIFLLQQKKIHENVDPNSLWTEQNSQSCQQ